MNKSKIDWCDRTWNPVTGCLHGCEYCAAAKFAKRFSGAGKGQYEIPYLNIGHDKWNLCQIDQPVRLLDGNGEPNGRIIPYPRGFEPTFHLYRLDQPQHIRKPQNIFVVFEGDLFGEWVPDKWIQKVFEACEKAPQHRYLFLTKNPDRYNALIEQMKLPIKHWYGTTATKPKGKFFAGRSHNSFVSIEPIHSKFDTIGDQIMHRTANWIIIGAETGNRKGKIIPKREWIESIVNQCRSANVPVFMKSNLKDIWGAELIQEYPWEEKEK